MNTQHRDKTETDRLQMTTPKSRLPLLLGAVVLIGAAWGLTRGRGSLALQDSYRKLEAGDAVAAAASAETAVSLLPGNTDALVQLGDAKSMLHNHAAAYTAYKYAHEALPAEHDTLIKMARQGLYELDLEYQAKALSDYLTSNPGDSAAMLLLGQTYERFPSTPGNESQALNWEEKAEQAAPGDEEIEAVLAGRFLAANHPDQALSYCQKGLDKHPDSPTLLRIALVCDDQLGRTTDSGTIAAKLRNAPVPDKDTPPYHPLVPASTAATTPSTGAKFVDVTASAGLNYSFRYVDTKPQNILQTIGNGCAFLDYDNDGNLDILLVSHLLKLYRGDGKGHFVDATASAGLDKVHGYFLGCAVGDFDNDGFDDIVLTGYDTVALLQNNHGHGYVDVTKQSGIQTAGWNTSAAWGDFDGDGKLDLYVCRYVKFDVGENPSCVGDNVVSGCGPNAYKPDKGVLYHNEGGGLFRNVTADWGAGSISGKSLGAALADFDGTGRPGLYLASDKVPSTLYANVGGRFQDISRPSGTSVREDGAGFSGMGVDWGDYDNDSKLDLAVMTFQREEKRVLHNEGGRIFTQQSHPLGFGDRSYQQVAFGVKWFDFDNDGWLDLLFANGHVDDNIQERIKDVTFLEPTLLYHNDHGSHFADVSTALGDGGRPIEGRGLAIGDFDNDGRVDALVVDSSGCPILLHNETQNAGHWLELNLVGSKSNRDGQGALVTVKAGHLTLLRQCTTGGSYLSASDKRVHFGLGASAPGQVDVSVHWPSGKVETYAKVGVNKVSTLRE